jgi:hypothetical protein
LAVKTEDTLNKSQRTYHYLCFGVYRVSDKGPLQSTLSSVRLYFSERGKNTTHSDSFLSLSLSLSYVRAKYSLRQLTLVKDKARNTHPVSEKNKPHPNSMLSTTHQIQTTHTSDICDFCVRDVFILAMHSYKPWLFDIITIYY